jgi:hypothetical protein
VRGYVCAEQPTGGPRCVEAAPLGGGGLGESCARLEDCTAGLYCDEGTCSDTPPFVRRDAAPPDAGRIDSMVGLPCMPAPADGGWPDGGGPCDDHSVCTIDSCSAMRCVNTLQDADLDGYASTILGSCGLDCSDSDPSVNPEHTSFEATRHAGNPPLEPTTFDWDCNRIEEREFTAIVPDCDASGVGTCSAGEGWSAFPPPNCGQTGTWQRCTGPGMGCVLMTVETRTQRCR